MATFHFELVSPEKLLFSGEVDQVVIPGADGEFTVLAQHAPLMGVLKTGLVSVSKDGAEVAKLFVGGGFADVSEKGLTILAEKALPAADLTAEKLAADIAAAQAAASSAIQDETRRVALEQAAQLADVKVALAL